MRQCALGTRRIFDTKSITAQFTKMDNFQSSLDFTQRLPPSVQEKIAEGMERCDFNANETWKRWVDGCIQRVASEKQEFTVDDVLAALDALPNPPTTRNLAALGPRMKRVSKELKYMTATDRVQRSRRPLSHGNLLRVWESRIWNA